MMDKKGNAEDTPSLDTPVNQENSMEAIMERYAEKFEQELKSGERYPGTLPEDRAKLAAIEDALRYNDEVMKTRCNS